MKNKDIRKKDNSRGVKERRANSDSLGKFGNESMVERYRITYDRYQATITALDTKEVIGIYKPAHREWKRGGDVIPQSIRASVERFYA